MFLIVFNIILRVFLFVFIINSVNGVLTVLFFLPFWGLCISFIIPSTILIILFWSFYVRNPIYTLLLVLFSFILASVLLINISSELPAYIFLIVYLGAVMMLFLFVVMLFNLQNLNNTNAWNLKYFLSFCILFSVFFFELTNTTLLMNNLTIFADPNILNLTSLFFFVKITVNSALTFRTLYLPDTIILFFFITLILIFALIGAISIALTTKSGFYDKRNIYFSQKYTFENLKVKKKQFFIFEIYNKWMAFSDPAKFLSVAILGCLGHYIYIFFIVESSMYYFILRCSISLVFWIIVFSNIKTKLQNDTNKINELLIKNNKKWLVHANFIYFIAIILLVFPNIFFVWLWQNVFFLIFFYCIFFLSICVFVYKSYTVFSLNSVYENKISNLRLAGLFAWDAKTLSLTSVVTAAAGYKTFFGQDAALPPVRMYREFRHGIRAETDSEYFALKKIKFGENNSVTDMQKESRDFWSKKINSWISKK